MNIEEFVDFENILNKNEKKMKFVPVLTKWISDVSGIIKQKEILEVSPLQRSPLWFECRKYTLTSSNFGAIIKRKKECYKFAKHLYISNSFTNNAMLWGITHEEDALIKYSTELNVAVKKGGFFVNKKYSFLGCSPDGLIGTNGLLEIKCPYSIRNTDSFNNLSANFFCTEVNQKLKLKKNHNYYYQIQGIMGIMNLDWCDFVVWVPNVMSVERINFDELFFEKMLSKLELFYINYYKKLKLIN